MIIRRCMPTGIISSSLGGWGCCYSSSLKKRPHIESNSQEVSPKETFLCSFIVCGTIWVWMLKCWNIPLEVCYCILLITDRTVLLNLGQFVICYQKTLIYLQDNLSILLSSLMYIIFPKYFLLWSKINNSLVGWFLYQNQIISDQCLLLLGIPKSKALCSQTSVKVCVEAHGRYYTSMRLFYCYVCFFTFNKIFWVS